MSAQGRAHVAECVVEKEVIVADEDDKLTPKPGEDTVSS
jgi:hypothetical protein